VTPWLQNLDQVGEREQTCQTERGSPGGHDYKRIVRSLPASSWK